jgi:biopolymer transport protein ExbD
MAFNFGSGGDDEPVLADINVTPLVDVMLVLLIIFMIAAPMLHQGVEVALPRADAANLPLRVQFTMLVSIDIIGSIYLRVSAV